MHPHILYIVSIFNFDNDVLKYPYKRNLSIAHCLDHEPFLILFLHFCGRMAMEVNVLPGCNELAIAKE